MTTRLDMSAGSASGGGGGGGGCECMCVNEGRAWAESAREDWGSEWA